VFYNRLAEVVGEYMKKGRPLYIEGRLKTRKWQNKEGVDQYTTEIVADQMQMLGGRDGGEAGGSMGGGGESAPRPAARAPQAQRPAAPAASGANLTDMDDDIPF